MKREKGRKPFGISVIFLVLLLSWALYVFPCWITQIKTPIPRPSGLRKAENNTAASNVPQSKDFSASKQGKGEDNETKTVKTVVKKVVKKKVVKKKIVKPEPIVDTVYNNIHLPPKIPQDILNDWKMIQAFDVEGVKQKQTEMSKDIDEIQTQMSAAEGFDVFDGKQAAEQIKEEVNQQLASRVQDGDRIPLVLTSIFGPKYKKGSTQFKRLKLPTEHRYDEAIVMDSTKRWCSPTVRANFSFWAPYPLWATSFVVTFPKKYADNAAVLSIQLLLEDAVVMSSDASQANGASVTFKLDKPTRFQRMRVTAGGSSSTVCIGEVFAYTPKKLRQE